LTGRVTGVNDYVVMGSLGSGAFGTVVEVERRVGESPYRRFALKVLAKKRLKKMRQTFFDEEKGIMVIQTGEDLVQQEIEVMRHLFHRNVVILFEVLDDLTSDYIGLVTELNSGGMCMAFDESTCRFSSVKGGSSPGLDEPTAARYFRDLVDGLAYLHSQGIAHRDIKPENLLVFENGTLRISDYGCAGTFSPSDPATAICKDTKGTEAFHPPEACAGLPFDMRQADAWAAALCLCCFMFGQLPFRPDLPPEALYESIQWDEPALPASAAEVQNGVLLQLITHMLSKEASERPSLEEVASHAWLEQVPPPPVIGGGADVQEGSGGQQGDGEEGDQGEA